MRGAVCVRVVSTILQRENDSRVNGGETIRGPVKWLSKRCERVEVVCSAFWSAPRIKQGPFGCREEDRQAAHRADGTKGRQQLWRSSTEVLKCCFHDWLCLNP